MNDEEKKDLLEHRKWIEEIEHMLEQRSHWKERAQVQDKQYNERAKSQDKHWKFQKFIWGLAATIAIITALGAPILTEYMRYIFYNQSVIEQKNETQK